MARTKLSLLLLIAVSLPIPSASAFDFTEFGVVSLFSPSFRNDLDSSIQTSSGYGFGGGVSFGFRVFSDWDIEPAFLFASRSYTASGNTLASTQYAFATFQVPLIIRYWFNPKFSFGAGGYLARGNGAVTLSQGANSTIKTYEDLSVARNDAGIVLSFRFKTPLNELMNFVLDGRFMIGLDNKDISGNGIFQARDFQTCIGIGFNL